MVINRYLRTNSVRKLQLGAGSSNSAGWLNTDIEPTFGQAYLLRESYRVLEPGGRIRIATPDLDRFLALFQANPTEETRRFLMSKPAWHGWRTTPDPACYILNREMHEWGHQFIYTERLLRASMESAGFRNIKRFPPGNSDDPIVAGIEIRVIRGDLGYERLRSHDS